MSDLMYAGEFTKVTNTLSGEMSSMFVVLWDIGPSKPTPPARPETPKGKPGEAEYDLAAIEFREELEAYEAALKAYARAKADYAEWEQKDGGAKELTMWSCDAADALARAPERYFISASTRGYERAPNRGLPPGHRPGRVHAENIQRRADGAEEMARVRAADPVFGAEAN